MLQWIVLFARVWIWNRIISRTRLRESQELNEQKGTAYDNESVRSLIDKRNPKSLQIIRSFRKEAISKKRASFSRFSDYSSINSSWCSAAKDSPNKSEGSSFTDGLELLNLKIAMTKNAEKHEHADELAREEKNPADTEVDDPEQTEETAGAHGERQSSETRLGHSDREGQASEGDTEEAKKAKEETHSLEEPLTYKDKDNGTQDAEERGKTEEGKTEEGKEEDGDSPSLEQKVESQEVKSPQDILEAPTVLAKTSRQSERLRPQASAAKAHGEGKKSASQDEEGKKRSERRPASYSASSSYEPSRRASLSTSGKEGGISRAPEPAASVKLAPTKRMRGTKFDPPLIPFITQTPTLKVQRIRADVAEELEQGQVSNLPRPQAAQTSPRPRGEAADGRKGVADLVWAVVDKGGAKAGKASEDKATVSQREYRAMTSRSITAGKQSSMKDVSRRRKKLLEMFPESSFMRSVVSKGDSADSSQPISKYYMLA
eukprot:424648-Hanusia_phi.AAC.2